MESTIHLFTYFYEIHVLLEILQCMEKEVPVV